MAWQQQWAKHPTVRGVDRLSLGERAADKMRNGMGSWPFVFVFFAVMIIWAVVNGVLHVGGGSGFDPYPFILLNLFLSMLAGIQAAALLIAAKRADAVASEVALHTETNTDDIKTLLAENTALTAQVKRRPTSSMRFTSTWPISARRLEQTWVASLQAEQRRRVPEGPTPAYQPIPCAGRAASRYPAARSSGIKIATAATVWLRVSPPPS
jgi:hypothetical protein